MQEIVDGQNNTNSEYSITEKFIQGDYSVIYSARHKKDGADGLKYLAKRYIDDAFNDRLCDKERSIAHNIERNCNKSITVPILTSEMIENKKYNILILRGNGLFVSQIIDLMASANVPEKDLNDLKIRVIKSIINSLRILHGFKNDGSGYLHLDLHPGNIFMENADLEYHSIPIGQLQYGEAGTAKFIDFSNSVGTDRTKEELIKDIVAFNQFYSAPEILERQYYAIGRATDMYSVVAILVRLYNLINVFNPDKTIKPEYLREQLSRYCNPIFGVALHQFIMIGLDPNPDYRFINYESMIDYLDRMELCNIHYYEGNYFELFKDSYGLGINKDDIDFERLYEEFNRKNYEASVKSLSKDLTQDQINYGQCYQVFVFLWQARELGIVSFENTHSVMFDLISCGVSACNHIVDAEFAAKLRNELYQWIINTKEDIPFEHRFRIWNRIHVSYQDICDYKTAQKILENNISSMENMDTEMDDLGRAYSAYGTNEVYLGGNPMPWFEKALQIFRHPDFNREFTLSRVLQYSFELNDHDLFELYCKDYFEVSADHLLTFEFEQKHPYMQLVFFKAVYSFYREKVDDSLCEKIADFYRLTVSQMNDGEDPYELIYKYIGLILWEHDAYKTVARRALKRSFMAVKEGIIDQSKRINILMCISYQNMAIYNDKIGESESNISLREQLIDHLKCSEWNYLLSRLDKEKVPVSSLLTYLYS